MFQMNEKHVTFIGQHIFKTLKAKKVFDEWKKWIEHCTLELQQRREKKGLWNSEKCSVKSKLNYFNVGHNILVYRFYNPKFKSMNTYLKFTCWTVRSRKVRSFLTGMTDLGPLQPIEVPRPPLSLTTTSWSNISFNVWSSATGKLTNGMI